MTQWITRAMWRLLTIIIFLPLTVVAQELSPYTVDKNSLVIFHVDRTIAFEVTDNDWGYPWIALPDCEASHDCITISMSGGTGKFTYLANEIYPDDLWVKIEVFAWLDHFSNPRHVFFNLYMFVAREWEHKLYFLAGSPIWMTREEKPRKYVTNKEFIEEIGATDLVEEIDGYACDNLGAPYYVDEDVQGGNNVDVRFGSMCARHGVFLDDLLQMLRKQQSPDKKLE